MCTSCLMGMKTLTRCLATKSKMYSVFIFLDILPKDVHETTQTSSNRLLLAAIDLNHC